MSNKNSHILLVEGAEDQEFIYQLSNYYQIPRGTFSIENKRGYERLIKNLPIDIEIRSDVKSIGIVVDADNDIQTRWQSICERLQESGYFNLPDRPLEEGLILEQDNMPTIGVWIMPDNAYSGILEDFAKMMVPDNDKLWQRAIHCVDQIPAEERRFMPTHTGKAYIHTWLAWQEEPGRPLGLSITKRYLAGDANVAQSFAGWMKQLFTLS
ncbi:MAG: DUF3226 domain-containing protein [Chloroflexota bacterium]